MATETFTGTGAGFADLTWTQISGSWSRSSNQGTVDGSFVSRYARCESDNGSVDMFTEVEWVTGDSANDRTLNVCVRYDASADTCYVLEVNDQLNRYILYRRNAGSDTVIDGPTSIGGGVAPGAGKKIRLEVSGTTLTGYWDGVQIVSATDSNITTGTRGGLASYNSNSVLRFDNFVTGSLAAGGPGVRSTSPAAALSRALSRRLRPPRPFLFLRAPQLTGASASVTSALGITATASLTAAASASVTAGLGITASASIVGPQVGQVEAGWTFGIQSDAVVTSNGAGAFSGALVEAELTTGVWTDITQYVQLPFSITYGRKTEFGEIVPGFVDLTLDNSTGYFTPGNGYSPFSPNWSKGKRIRCSLVKGGVTYTRIVAIIQSIDMAFPTGSTNTGKVSVRASDALSRMAQRRLRSNWTEAHLAAASGASVKADAFEPVGTTNGWFANMTNFSTDAAALPGSSLFNGSWPNASFTTDRDVSCGQVVTVSPDSSGNSNKVSGQIQTGSLCVQCLVKLPTAIPATVPFFLVSLDQSGVAANYINIAVEPDGVGTSRLVVYDAPGTSMIGILHTPCNRGQWVMLTFTQNAGTPTQTDVAATGLGTGTVGTVTGVPVDIRVCNQLEFPGATGIYSASSLGGVVASGRAVPLGRADAYPSGAQGALSARLPDLTAALTGLGLSYTQVGALTTTVVTGEWSGRPALDVAREMMRSTGGIVWARCRDSQVMFIDGASLYPSTPVATFDADEDLLGPPRLSDSSDSKPTRLEATYPGGSTVVVDSAAEAAGEFRSQSWATVNAVASTASANATTALARYGLGLRITQLTIDLTNSTTDWVPTLFEQSSTLGGLYPTQRVRVAVYPEIFGRVYMDGFVQGWTETYAPNNRAWITMDLTPAADLATPPAAQRVRDVPGSLAGSLGAVTVATSRRRRTPGKAILVRNR